ncbi:MAG: cation transporter [Deltaproteobacteria bacterium]|nr:MAG: cation transporter [Deltaproteobacteria bacterium]
MERGLGTTHPSRWASSPTAPPAPTLVPMSTPAAPATGTASVRIALAAVAFSVLLLAAKLLLAWITGSTAILSDGIESSANVLTSAFAAFAAWLGSRPRDADHPYGHGKVEYFSVALEGVLLSVAAVLIAIVAIPRVLDPPDVTALDVGAIGMALIALVTAAGARFLVRRGRTLQSPALEADGKHLMADAITSSGVFVGITLVHVTGLPVLDPLVAVLIAGLILFNAVRILRQAIAGLMDEADPVLLDDIARVLEEHRQPGWLAPHLTRVHRLGQAVHIDLHLVLPRYWSIDRGHDAATVIEKAMQQRFGTRNETMVHMEPCTPISCPYCDVEDCPVRESPFSGTLPWSGESIRRGSRAEAIAHTTGEGKAPRAPAPDTLR